MDGMDDWCTKHHRESGLTKRVLESSISMDQAESQILDFLKLHIPEPKVGVLAGNSVHVDRQFLCKDMPRIVNHLHYRIVDVSTVKELCRYWYPGLKAFHKKGLHRAFDDIEESIEELKFYRKNVFKQILLD